MAEKAKNTDQRYLFTPKELAIFLNISVAGVQKRINSSDDFPKDARKGHGLYDIRVFLPWAITKYNTTDAMAEAKLLKEQARARQAQLITGEMEKSLIDLETLKGALAFLGTGVKQRLMAWSKSLPPYLINKEEKEVGQILRTEIRSILLDLSRGIISIMPKKTKVKPIKKGAKK